jgi:hypothetical protein
MLLLGVLQAQAAGGVAGAGSFDLLEEQVLTTTPTSVTFSGLSTYAADYKHLQLRMVLRGNNPTTSNNAIIQFNGDTGANYARHAIFNSGSSVGSFGLSSQNWFTITTGAGGTMTANAFGAGVVDILDPFNTSKNTTARALSGNPTDGISLFSGAWFNTAAINSINIDQQQGGDWVTGSRFSLYGIRAV